MAEKRVVHRSAANTATLVPTCPHSFPAATVPGSGPVVPQQSSLGARTLGGVSQSHTGPAFRRRQRLRHQLRTSRSSQFLLIRANMSSEPEPDSE
eukprot:3812574-Rhodomonas_salina.1